MEGWDITCSGFDVPTSDSETLTAVIVFTPGQNFFYSTCRPRGSGDSGEPNRHVDNPHRPGTRSGARTRSGLLLGDRATKLSGVVIRSCNSSIHPLSLTLSPRCSESVPRLSEHMHGPIKPACPPGHRTVYSYHINGDQCFHQKYT